MFGEGVYVEYRLYFLVKTLVFLIMELLKHHNTTDFGIRIFKINGLPVKIGKYNGERYRYAVLQKALLIPTKSGKLTLDPMKMDIIVAVPTGRADFFGNAITRNVRRDFSSARKAVRVKDLPLENKPADFNGAVGDFNFCSYNG